MNAPLTLFVLQVTVAVSLGEPVFLQVSPDAEPRPLNPPLTFQPGLVHRVHHSKDYLPVGLGAAAVGRGGRNGGASFSLRMRVKIKILIQIMISKLAHGGYMICNVMTFLTVTQNVKGSD